MEQRNDEIAERLFGFDLNSTYVLSVRLFALLTVLLLTNAGCRQFLPNSDEQTKNQKSMQYQLNHAVFDAPPTLRDITLYSFGKPDKSQLVEVNNSEREVSLDKLAAEITDQATDGLGLKLENSRDTKIDEMPARILTFTGEEHGTPFQQFVVLAIVHPSAESRIRHLEIKYRTKENAETANAKLEKIIKSARRTSNAPMTESSADYTRRFAGAISFDIPNDLLGGGFQFTLRDDSPAITDESVTFEVSESTKSGDKLLLETNANQKEKTSGIEAEMETDIKTDLNSGGQILERATKDLSNAEFKGEVLSYAVNNAPPWEKQPKNKLVRRAYLQISGDVEVRIVGRADSRKREIFEQNFNQIVTSVRKK